MCWRSSGGGPNPRLSRFARINSIGWRQQNSATYRGIKCRGYILENRRRDVIFVSCRMRRKGVVARATVGSIATWYGTAAHELRLTASSMMTVVEIIGY